MRAGNRGCQAWRTAQRTVGGPDAWYTVAMIEVLGDAIERIRRLPEDRQAYAAEILEQIARSEGKVSALPEDHRAAVLEGLGEGERVVACP